MEIINEFFALERQQAGWCFWFFWVLITNIGFFTGWVFAGAVGSLVPALSNPQMMKAAESAVSTLGFAFLVGLLRARVLRRHISDRGF